MYFYFQPRGGFNDIFSQLILCMKYCVHFKKILLLDTKNSEYRINFSDYFTFNNSITDHLNIITDFNEIKKIVYENPEFTIYPNCLQGHIKEIIDGDLKMKVKKIDEKNSTFVDLNDNKLTIPYFNVKEDILVYINWGGANGFTVFSQLIINPAIVMYCKKLYEKLPKPYIAIQIRNTDYKCDYQKLYLENKDMIHSYKAVYIATDDKKSIDFFKTKKLKVFNFCHFPPSDDYENLHYSKDVDPDVKMKDLMTDILIVSMADKLLSKSIGLFIYFLYNAFMNKNVIKNMFSLK
jgi:hypothetical protein